MTGNRGRRLTLVGAALLLSSCASPISPRDAAGITEQSGPSFAASGPNAEDYGASLGYPIGDRTVYYTTPFLVGSHSHLDEIFEGHVVQKAAAPSRLKRADMEPGVRWQLDGLDRPLEDYFARNPATGLLIARGDTIFVERYQYGRTDRDRFTSWSMAKTVTSMLIGIAIAEGRIRAVDDVASAYVPGLAGTEYGKTPLRHLLQMSSGVRFTEEYSGRDDVTRLASETFRREGAGGVGAVTHFNERAVRSGTKFSYASVETQVLGLVLRAAVGRPVAEYLQEKIWQPIGAEGDATWLTDNSGQEVTFCCLNAVLRDYARLGLLLAHDGDWRGKQLIPVAWIMDATTVRGDQPHLRPGRATPYFGYGYQTWIFPSPDERRQFAFLGVRGQTIFVDPRSRLVMVHTAVRKQSRDPGVRETVALWRGVVKALGN